MKNNLYIPSKIKVGFKNREDTYNGKLAYIIYFDEKGILHKEKSWHDWREKTIEPIELDNTPSRFVFNKNVQRSGYFGSGRSIMRVYDQRDFEFEISIENLVGILMHSDISKRDILEECVFAWSGKNLVLLPINSEEYRQSIKYTSKQSNKFSSKELVKGFVYETKKSNKQLIYIGYYEYYSKDYSELKYVGKKHIFYDIFSGFVTPSLSTISHLSNPNIHEDFSDLSAKFFDSFYSKPMIDFGTKNFENNKNSLFKKINDNYIIKINYDTFSTQKSCLSGLNIYLIKINKTNDSLSYEHENFESNNYQYFSNKINQILKDTNSNISFEISYYYYNSVRYSPKFNGDDISFSELKQILLSVGFHNSLCVIDENHNEYEWS